MNGGRHTRVDEMRVRMRARRTALHEMVEHSDAELTELMPGTRIAPLWDAA